MRILHDHQGLAIRLTDERMAHILDHPEMKGLGRAIEKKGVLLWPKGE
jgi:hypothetical protein